MSGGYQVIARKWRPQRFDEIVGQDAVVRTLSNALAQNRLAHAYCFSGIRGVGKTTAARLLAKGLNCRASESPTAEPCGRCESCAEIEGSRSLDVVELDAASQTGVDNIRELTEVTRYAPTRDRYRVFIIDEAHMLSASAFNALLKTLEEPPPHVVFVLATTEPQKILPTVLSRCQHYQFGRISQREIVGHLGKIASAEGIEISRDALALLATAADGSLRDGQSLLDKLIAFAGETIDEGTVIDLLGLVDRVLLFRATELVADGDVAGALGFVDEMVDSGVDLHQFTVDLLGHFRNLLIVRTVREAGPILHLPDGDIERLRQQAEAFTIEDLDRAFSLIAANEYRIKNAEQPRYHVEIVLARLARMPTVEPIGDLLAELRGEGGASGGGAPSGGGSRRSTSTKAASARPAKPAARARAESSAKPAEPVAKPEAVEKAKPAEPEEPITKASEREKTPEAASEPEEPPHPADDPRHASADPRRSSGKASAEDESVDQDESVNQDESVDASEREPEPERTESAADDEEPEVAAEASEAETAAESPDPEPRPAATEAAPGDDLPMPALLRKIQEQVALSHPLIAQVLDRCGGISVAGERLELQFAPSHGIFVQRLREPEMIQLLGQAARTVTGREVVARVQMSDSVSARLRPAPDEAPLPDGDGSDGPAAEGPSPTPEESGQRPESAASPAASNGASGGPPPEASPGPTPSPVPDAADPAALRARAEQEPKIQEFLKALRGQIVSVEELPDR